MSKQSKGSSPTRVVEEITAALSVESAQAIPNLSEFVEMLDPIEEEVQEMEVLVTSRRRRPVNPPIAKEPEALAMVVAGVLVVLE